MKLSKKLLEAAEIHFTAELIKAETNLENYIQNSAAIGEHPDVVHEVITLIKMASEAEEALEYTKKKIREKTKEQYENKD